MTAAYNRFGGPRQRFTAAIYSELRGGNAFVGGRMPVAPSSASYRYSNRVAVSNSRLSSAAGQRFFQSSQYRSVYRPQPAQRQASSNSFGAPRGTAPNGAMRNSPRGFSSGQTARPSPSGWQRFGDPGNGTGLRQGFDGNGVNRSGWHSFGEPQQPYANGQRNGSYRNTPSPQATPRSSYTPRTYSPSSNGGQYAAPRYNTPTAPRYNTPSYRSPSYNAPSYNATPRPSAPRMNTPSMPRMNAPSTFRPQPAPRFNSPSGGGSRGGSFQGGSRPAGGNRGGGGSRSSGGGGHHR
jgi:hypothetical protein